MKKLVFLTARLPYPASSGRKNVMYNYCKILHDYYGYNITIVSYLEDGDIPEQKPDFIDRVIVLPGISFKTKIKNLFFQTFIKRSWPMQVSLFWDPKNANKVKKLLESIEPEIVIADMVRMTEYASKYQNYKIADLDDLLSIRYERQLSQDMRLINPYGAYLNSLPRIVQNILSSNEIKVRVLKNEIKLLKKYEKSIAKRFDKTIFVADREAQILNKELEFNKALGIPLGVDIEYFGRYSGKQNKKEHTIAFLGAMSVAHNEAGAIYFIKNIFPMIQKRIPDAQFIVVGGGITNQLQKISKANSGVVLTGRVEDVRTVIGECEVFVCPLIFGSGIKTKNLEAMAMGIPVVTTAIGAENINAIDGKDWLIATDDQDFATKVIRVIKDKKLSKQLSENGKDFVKNNFTWDVAKKRMKSII